MECTNLVDPHQLLCHWFTVVFVLFCIYIPDNQFPKPIVKQGGGLFWILFVFWLNVARLLVFLKSIYDVFTLSVVFPIDFQFHDHVISLSPVLTYQFMKHFGTFCPCF